MFAAKCLRYIPSLKAASKQSIGRCTCQKFAILHNNRTFAFAVKDQVEFDDFLSENQYFAKQNIGNEHAPNTEYCELDIGILGKELIRNWEAEWWKFIVMTNPMAVGISEEATIQWFVIVFGCGVTKIFIQFFLQVVYTGTPPIFR